jgi:hypothetical protein
MAGTIVADTIQADSTSTLVLKNGVANTPPTIQDSAGTQIGTFCRAWVNFNGTTNTGGFCTIRSSFNVTTVADNGTGDYTINFTNAMPDADYAAMGGTSFIGTTNYVGPVAFNNNNATAASVAPTTTALRAVTRNSSGGQADPQYVYVAIFR